MEAKKRVYCLYRVSKQEQVEKDDIPMQKQACREFAERQGWEIAKEFYEKGVSGFKVSSKDRDAILEIQREAAMGNFDILLVFMFDRLGRKDDETPFVVQWFIRNNVAVWSVNEGEQRLDTHTDKLLNYIRYWQASGESIKTSIRVKAGLARIVGEGYHAGGTAPFGYRLEKSGRINEKKGNETLKLELADDATVEAVRTIFSKYVNEGYGCQRIVRYMHEQGVVKANGRPFSRCNIYLLLQNELYIGYVKRSDTRTYVPRLRIIDDDTFNRAQELRVMRNKNSASNRWVPMSTKGASLLSGNIFCGHCGGKLTFSPEYVKYMKKNGEISSYNAAGYQCKYGQSLGGSTCQQRYVARKVDDAVRSVLQRVFEQIRETPPTDCWERQHERRISEIKAKIKTKTGEVAKLNKELMVYKSEVIKVIQGNSAFTAEVLNELINDTEDKISKQNAELDGHKAELNKSDGLYAKTKEEHTRIRSWSEIFNESSPETQKMVAASLISAVRMHRGYQMEIDFNISVKEFVDAISFNAENISVSVEN